jgi:hypothetical protein
MIFNVTYYLELHDTIQMYKTSHVSPTKCGIGSLEQEHLYLVKEHIICETHSTMQIHIVSDTKYHV